MSDESAISLKNRTDSNVAETLSVPHLLPRSNIQRPNCWGTQENIDFIDTVVRGWTCPPIYMIVRDSDEDEYEQCNCGLVHHEVFDGAHKIEAIIKYMKGEFSIDKVHETSPLKIYVGKKFSGLPKNLQERIKNYKFMINFIDSETANDRDTLRILWERLNKAGKKLNDHELALPIISGLVNDILKPSINDFLESHIFPKKESKRGELEKLQQMILATSETSLNEKHLKKFQSKKQLVAQWQKESLGDKITEITVNTEKNKEKWINILKRAKQYMDDLSKSNCFVDAEGKNILESAHRTTELIFLLGRSVYYFKKEADFRRAIDQGLAFKVREKFFLNLARDDKGRNGSTQVRILKEVDAVVYEYSILKTPRAFTKKQIDDKFKEQNGICAICEQAILSNQEMHGDHIVPFHIGGQTESSNLQVTHARCNLLKGGSV